MTITTKDKKGGYVTAVFTANGYVDLNNSDDTIGANTVGETVNTMHLVNVKWSASSNGYWQISRGGNTLINLAGSGNVDFQEDAMRIDALGGNAQANVVVSGVDTPAGFVAMKLHKKSTFTSEY